MKKHWLAAIVLALSLLLTAGSCGTQGPPQGGVWDSSQWDSVTWQ
jgi:hypothetical protein